MIEGEAQYGAGGRRGAGPRWADFWAALRLLRGEHLETVSQSLGPPPHQPRGVRLAAAEAALATGPNNGEALESERLKARLGETC